MNPIDLQLALNQIPEEEYADLPTQVLRGLTSGATLGFVRPFEQAGKGGFPETLANIAGGVLPFLGIQAPMGLGAAALGRFVPKLLAKGVTSPQAIENLLKFKPRHTGLSATGRVLTTGGTMGAMAGLEGASATEPKTATERLTDVALSAGLGMATEGLLQRLFRGVAPSRGPTAPLGEHPSITQQPMQWLERPLREEYQATLGRLQARRTEIVNMAGQATEGVLDKRRFKEIQGSFRKQVGDIDKRIEELTKRAAEQGGLSLGGPLIERGLPLGEDVVEGVQRPAWAVTPPGAEVAQGPADAFAGMTSQDLRAFLKQRGFTIGEDVPRGRLIQMITQKALPPPSGMMPTRSSILPGVNVSTPTVMAGTRSLIHGIAPTSGGGILPYTKISPPPELAKKFGIGIGVTEIDPQTKMLVNPDSWYRKAKNVLKAEPTGIDPELLGPGIYMVRNAQGRLLPRDLRLAADIANDSMFPSLADLVCR